MNYEQEYEIKRQLVESCLNNILKKHWPASPELLSNSIEYSLLATGKRIRPVLMLASTEMCGGDSDKALEFSCALEMIHTYSLIHDDLPGMDDDDYRRGRLSNHKVYGVGMAILAGDGLLNAAYELMLKNILFNCCKPNLIKAMDCIADAAGINGMIAGQCVDLQMEGIKCDAQTLDYIHENKTGKIITSAVISGGYIADASEKELYILSEYGKKIGLAFQITDDILDIISDQEVLGKPVGSDEKNDKMTYPKLYGLNNAQKKVNELIKEAIDLISGFRENAWFLQETARAIATRKK